MKRTLTRAFNSLIEGDVELAEASFSSYLTAKSKSMLAAQAAPVPRPIEEHYVYDVYDSKGELIDTVFSSSDDTEEDFKRSLVNHDGYDYDIVVKKNRKKKHSK